MRRAWLAVAGLVVVADGMGAGLGPIQYYRGACDASAACALEGGVFVAASDEDNRLRLYRHDAPGLPVREFDVSAFLAVKAKTECDLEAAARIGSRIYWIGSHGPNRDGEERWERQVMFATEFSGTGAATRLTPVGLPYRGLLRDLERVARTAQLVVRGSRGKGEARATEIEGLAAWPDGQLLMGFRGPLVQGRTAVVALENPEAVLLRGERARIGERSDLDLGGLGIWDMTAVGQRVYLVAGPVEGQGRCRIYRWDGRRSSAAPVMIGEMDSREIQPEALLSVPGRAEGEFLLLSDDGGTRTDGEDCKDLKAASDRRFRSAWFR